MMTTEKRIAVLEKRRHYRAGDVGCAICLKGDETIEDACKRLGLADASGRIVVGEVLEPDCWDRIAGEQQAALVQSMKLIFPA